MYYKDLTGKKFGKLTAVAVEKSHGGHIYWRCTCECGAEKIVRGSHLLDGHTTSCGCSPPRKTHGESRSRLYVIWNNMKQRCGNPVDPEYQAYGGRGITVCSEWCNSFEAFRDWALANGYSDDLTIDRKNNDGPYTPENCRWATPKQQSNNTRRNRTYIHNGQEKTIPRLAMESGLRQGTIRERLSRGWTLEEALSPLKPTGKARKSVDAEKLKELRNNGVSVRKSCEILGISAPTYYRVLEETKNES